MQSADALKCRLDNHQSMIVEQKGKIEELAKLDNQQAINTALVMNALEGQQKRIEDILIKIDNLPKFYAKKDHFHFAMILVCIAIIMGAQTKDLLPAISKFLMG